jgi:hypothetical protein
MTAGVSDFGVTRKAAADRGDVVVVAGHVHIVAGAQDVLAGRAGQWGVAEVCGRPRADLPGVVLGGVDRAARLERRAAASGARIVPVRSPPPSPRCGGR